MLGSLYGEYEDENVIGYVFLKDCLILQKNEDEISVEK